MNFYKIAKSFLRDKHGVFAIKFALTSIPLLLAVGIAVDYSRINKTKSQLQDAADSAALYAAATYRQNQKKKFGQARNDGKDMFSVNSSNIEEIKINNVKVNFDSSKNTVIVEARGVLKPMFMRIFGYPKFHVSVTSEANIGETVGAEIAFVVDATNSMKFDNRWDNTMDAMNNVFQQLKSYTGNDNLYLSLIPYQDRVNVGKSRTNWFDGAPPASSPAGDWKGCADPRENKMGKLNWTLDDKAPTQGNRFGYSTQFDETGLGGRTGSGAKCFQSEITGPTNDVDEIIEAGKALSNNGTGRIDIGMAWGWRILSPRWRGYWDKFDYPALNVKDRKKYIVFISDGNTNAYKYEMSKEEDWGWNEGSKVAFEHLVDLCRRIKKENIEIYMLKVSGNPHAKTYFEQCASSPTHYFDVDGVEDIELAFENILSGFESELRIVN